MSTPKHVTLARLMALLDLYGTQFDRALAADDWVEMERSRVRSRAAVKHMADLMA